MKVFFIIALCFQATLFAQENPWENKNQENPWETTEEPVEEKTEAISIAKDTLRAPAPQISEAMEPAEVDKIYALAKTEAQTRYQSSKDFAVGFASGLLLNGYGTAVDALYMIHYNKAEKEINTAINSDTTYAALDDKKLEYQTKRALKNKKFGAAVGGTVLGSITQIAAVIGFSILL